MNVLAIHVKMEEDVWMVSIDMYVYVHLAMRDLIVQ